MRGQHACSQSGPPSTPQTTISHLLAESARGICGISQPIVAPNHARYLSRGWFNVRPQSVCLSWRHRAQEPWAMR
jgi:hypothetical protein